MSEANQTIADFRAALTAAGSFRRLFEAFLAHLQREHGLVLAKAGVIVDATFVEVPKQRNTREQNAQIKAGEIPPAFNADAKLRAHKDTDARWAMKDFQAYFGYKNHCKVDVADKLILAAKITPANVHDIRPFAGLVRAGDGSVHADCFGTFGPHPALRSGLLAAGCLAPLGCAYKSAANDADLAAKAVTGHINIQGSKAHPLSEKQKAANRERSKVRCRVEHVFAQMRGTMRALWQRCIGLTRNTAGIQLSNLVYNMVRFEQIQRLHLRYQG